jgi:hypothetical protein
MAESPVNSEFAMFSARAAMSGGLTHIETQAKALERAVIENPGLAFDLARTLVESACKTILTDRKIPFGSDDELPKLFKAVTTTLPFLPKAASGEGEGRKSLAQTISGLHTALQGICELRNSYGFASHGADGPRPLMESAQALLAAQAADAIIGFLHRAHRQDQTALPAMRLEFLDNEGFNDFVDDIHDPVEIFDLQYRPSEVLFNVDLDAYRDKLAQFGSPVQAEVHREPEVSAAQAGAAR